MRVPSPLSSMLYFQMVIMAGTVMLAYYFEYTDTFAVNVQGFFCYEGAYRKPYPGPEDSSAVPPVLLYSLTAGVPVLVVSPGRRRDGGTGRGATPAAGGLRAGPAVRGGLRAPAAAAPPARHLFLAPVYVRAPLAAASPAGCSLPPSVRRSQVRGLPGEARLLAALGWCFTQR